VFVVADDDDGSPKVRTSFDCTYVVIPAGIVVVGCVHDCGEEIVSGASSICLY